MERRLWVSGEASAREGPCRPAILLHPETWHGCVKTNSLRHYATIAFACALIIGGIAAFWSGAGLYWRKPCGWMALIAALDAALVLRLAGLPSGSARGRLALLATALAIPAGAFVVAATCIGLGFGTLPHEAVWRIDPGLVVTWWRLNGSIWDALALPLSLPLAWYAGR